MRSCFRTCPLQEYTSVFLRIMTGEKAVVSAATDNRLSKHMRMFVSTNKSDGCGEHREDIASAIRLSGNSQVA